MTVIDEGYLDVEEDTHYYWQLTAPIGTKDVDLNLGTIIASWGEDEQKLAIRAIASKLRIVAGMLDEQVTA
jgi:hypothetical protein